MKVGLNREGNDKFYTKKEIVKICYDIISEKNIIQKEDLVIEPSAGNGAFIEFIKLLTNNYRFYDISPENCEVISGDFLTVELPKEKFHVIGNPPFGRQSSLAKKFIKKCRDAETISFILPKSFKKESMQKSFPLNFHLIHEEDLPKNSFTVEEKDHDVPCVFQIWKKENFNRNVEVVGEPKNFKFVKKTEDHDISFRRVGVYAGNIDTKTDDKSVSTHYFIKFLDAKLSDRLQEFKNIKFDTDNTVGPKSISKPELIKEFNKIVAHVS